jgi:hypothetical protein
MWTDLSSPRLRSPRAPPRTCTAVGGCGGSNSPRGCRTPPTRRRTAAPSGDCSPRDGRGTVGTPEPSQPRQAELQQVAEMAPPDAASIESSLVRPLGRLSRRSAHHPAPLPSCRTVQLA